MAIQFMNILGQGRAAWAGFAGAVVAILGAILLAADKGALMPDHERTGYCAGRKVLRNDAGPAGDVF